jgi:hypothetical protein
MIRPSDAWVIASLDSDLPVSDEKRHAVSIRFRPLVFQLASLPIEQREGVIQAFLSACTDRDAIDEAITNAAPEGPQPEAEDERLFATLADIARTASDQPWLWKGWIARGVFNVVASQPGTGKTRFALDLARRLYLGLKMPDGQDNEMPQGTRTLWVQADQAFPEMVQAATEFGLPHKAVALGSLPDDPYGGLSLDGDDAIAALAQRIRAANPGLVIIDTVGMATNRDLTRPEEAKALFAPIIELARETGVAILGLTHLNKEGQALGRRIVEKARVVIMMTNSDPDGQPNRRRLWVDKSAAIKPPPLGITMGNTGNEYDFCPSTAAKIDQGGRPPIKLAKAIAFITEKLREGDCKYADLISAWESSGEAKGTAFNAIKGMQSDGRLVIDDTVKPKICHLVNDPPSDGFNIAPREKPSGFKPESCSLCKRPIVDEKYHFHWHEDEPQGMCCECEQKTGGA